MQRSGQKDQRYAVGRHGQQFTGVIIFGNMRVRKIVRRLGFAIGSLAIVALIVLFGTGVGTDLRNGWKHGIIQAALDVDKKDRKYVGDPQQNLRTLYQAVLNYQESEGQFPPSDKWMDAIGKYNSANDLSPGEADKKFVDPSLVGQPGDFGYAMNDGAAGKFFDSKHKVKDDFPDPKTILIFTSSDVKRNAHGDPKSLAPNPPRGDNLAITVDGTVVKLSK